MVLILIIISKRVFFINIYPTIKNIVKQDATAMEKIIGLYSGFPNTSFNKIATAPKTPIISIRGELSLRYFQEKFASWAISNTTPERK